MKKLKTVAEVGGTIGTSQKKVPVLSKAALDAVLSALVQADALATSVIRGSSAGQIAQALSVARSIAELERELGLKLTERR